MILQVDMIIIDSRFKYTIQLHTPLQYIAFSTVSYFLSEIFRIPADSKSRNLEIFMLFFKETQRCD